MRVGSEEDYDGEDAENGQQGHEKIMLILDKEDKEDGMMINERGQLMVIMVS